MFFFCLFVSASPLAETDIVSSLRHVSQTSAYVNQIINLTNGFDTSPVAVGGGGGGGMARIC